tara:strand:+ start:714 stop:1103 length:390 start_codon:yes stop_codon:yes gene_type:complete
MSEKFNLEIISPEKILIKDQVESVTIPSFEGEMTLLSNHVSLITFLRPGITTVLAGQKSEYFVEEGTVEFSKNSLIILSSSIINLKELSKEKINQMISECEKSLKQEKVDDKKNYILSHKVDVLSRINL